MSNCIRIISLCVIIIIDAIAQPELAQPKPSRGFTVAVVQGDGIVNELPRPPLTRVSIRVADSNGQPVRDAVAVFQFPEAGASAMFSDGSVVKVLLTNANGEAVGEVKSNEVPGRYQPTVTVNYLGQSSVVKLHQANAFSYVSPRPPKRSFLSPLKKPIFSAMTVAAVGVLVALTRGTSTPPPGDRGITVTPGNGSVGGSR